MPRNIMTGGMDRSNRVRKSLRQGAADDKRRLKIIFLQYPQDSPDSHPRSIFAPGVLFGVDAAFRIRLQPLGSLVVEYQIDCAPKRFRPFELLP